MVGVDAAIVYIASAAAISIVDVFTVVYNIVDVFVLGLALVRVFLLSFLPSCCGK